jgi:predicted RNA-binding Zn ribbon-like protein
MRIAPIDDLGRAIEVVNSWDTFDPQVELIPDLEMLGRFLRWIGRPDLRDAIRDGDLERFRTVRAGLREAFEATDEPGAIEALNRVLAAWPARVWAEQVDGPHGGLVLRHESATGDPIGTLATLTSTALVDAIRIHGPLRHGICAGAPCTCVFVDKTRNRKRRFCSEQCNDRVAQQAHRNRKAAARSA